MDNGKTKKEAEVSNQIAKMEKVIAELDESVSLLRGRIEPILKVQPPEPTTEKNAIESDIVPLALIIRQFRGKLEKCNDNIRAMLATCEL